MKNVAALVLLFASLQANGQLFKKCTVYQYAGPKSKKKKVVLTQTYNKRGKLTREVSSDYLLFFDNPSIQTFFKENGMYDYSYNDTTLRSIVEHYVDDITGKIFDSTKTTYYYNKDKRLVKEIRWQNMKLDTPGHIPGSSRDTILYKYNDEGLLVEKNGAYGDSTREFLLYDDQRRLITDSVASYDRLKAYCKVLTYQYTGHGYREMTWMCNREHPIVIDYTLDAAGHVLEQRTFFHRDEDRPRSADDDQDRHSFVFDENGNDFKMYDRTVNEYNAAGYITLSSYYYNGKLTTTHEFVYK